MSRVKLDELENPTFPALSMRRIQITYVPSAVKSALSAPGIPPAKLKAAPQVVLVAINL